MAKKNYPGFLNALGQRESGGDYGAVNQFGYLGKYQFGELALRDIGYYTYDGTSANDWKAAFWTGKNGVDNRAEFLANHAAQESAIREYMELQWDYLKNVWAYEGQTLNGVKITESGMLAGAHLVGAGNMANYLTSGAAASDGNGVSVETYVKQFAGYATPFSARHGLSETINGGTGEDILSGRGGNDKLYGGGAHDILRGGPGHDLLVGGGGNDTLRGSGGNDSLNGGPGRDLLGGGAGADTFHFGSLKHSLVGARRDKISDFSHRDGDIIDLRRIDADTDTPGNQAFKFIGAQKFHKVDGELRYKNHILQGDVNGDGKADFQIYVNVGKLQVDDFLL